MCVQICVTCGTAPDRVKDCHASNCEGVKKGGLEVIHQDPEFGFKMEGKKAVSLPRATEVVVTDGK